MDTARLEELRRALATDRTIDIVTVGARTGQPRTTEIWFTVVDEEIFICGTPAGDGSPGGRRKRDWVANLKAHPEFDFVLKESVRETLRARATVITDADERTRVFSAPATGWYRDATGSLEDLVAGGPLVKVTFVGEAAPLNPS